MEAMRKQYLWMIISFIGLTACIPYSVRAKVDTLNYPDPTAYYYEAGRKQPLWINTDEVVDFSSEVSTNSVTLKSVLPQAKLLKTVGRTRIWHAPTHDSVRATTQKTLNNASVSPVFRAQGKGAAPRMALPGNIFITFKADWNKSQIENWLNARNLSVVEQLSYDPQTFIIKTEAGIAALNLANEIYQSGEVVSATPNWWREVFSR